MTKFQKISTLIFAIIGLLLALDLCKIYYDANFNPYALASFCSVTDFIDCDGVSKTIYSQFLGIPLSLWGVCFYSFVLILLFSEKLSNYKFLKFLEVFKNPMSYIFSLSLVSFFISILLASISLFKIQKICILCFSTYMVDLALAVIAKDFLKSPLFEIKQSFLDFFEAIKIKKYLIAFCSVFLIALALISYTSFSGVLTPQNKKEDISYSQYRNYETDGTSMGNKNAKIVIHEYMDFNCTSCYMLSITLNRIMNELDGVRVVQHNLPLDGACNPLVKDGHVGSCLMARYALAANLQGKYWEANELLFAKTPTNENDILLLLKEIKGLNITQLNKDANSEEIKRELKKEIDMALKKDIDATPTLIINMQKITGNVPFYDLKTKLLNSGAKEKKHD